MTSDPAALVAMLYDRAISCLKMAVQAIHSRKIEIRWKNNRRAQEIINDLFTMLDMDKGGEIASNLEALYTYMLLRLPDVDINNDPRAAEEVIELLEPLRASWRELARSSADIEVDQQGIDAVAAIAVDTAA
jgi:flagellar protein FliS